MRYRSFPRIPNVPISVLGFGCMRLPVLDGDMARIDDSTAIPLLRGAIDLGINYVDTAYLWHPGCARSRGAIRRRCAVKENDFH